MGPAWKIDPMNYRTMSERSYHGAVLMTAKKWIIKIHFEYSQNKFRMWSFQMFQQLIWSNVFSELHHLIRQCLQFKGSRRPKIQAILHHDWLLEQTIMVKKKTKQLRNRFMAQKKN